MRHDPRFDEVRDAQQVFRRLVEASSWPGRLMELGPTRVEPPNPWSAALIQVARTVLDAQVTFAVTGTGDEELTRYLALNSGARPAALELAEYAIAGAPFDFDVSALRAGTAIAPELSATLLIACATLDETGDGAWFELSGRGVDGDRQIVVDEGTAGLLGRVAAREDEYPLGIDLFLIGPSRRLVALPRTTRWWRRVPSWAT